MGIVYKAHDRQTDRDVALKVLVEREEKLTDRFAQEVELLSALEHRHIVGYVAHGVTDRGAPYLVMPWLEGQDLRACLDRGPLSVEETLALARCVADALAYLHGRGLVHRDLKPSNLFLPRGQLGEVKVIDLGIARGTLPSRPLTLSGVLLGTPGFMAPEQARGDHEVSPTADIFSLGCVLFECLTGQRLFGGSHVMAVLAKILIEEPPRVRELSPGVPAALDLLINSMVAKDPAHRPRDGAALVRLLDELRRAPPGSGRSR
jgi:serine/threonine protein kinase